MIHMLICSGLRLKQCQLFLGELIPLLLNHLIYVSGNLMNFPKELPVISNLFLKKSLISIRLLILSAGSYYIENLTNLIADNAWKLFLEIEDQGGFLASLKSGFIQKKISESASKRRNETGFQEESSCLEQISIPNTEEDISDSVDLNRVFSKTPDEEDLTVEPITLFRGAEEYEKLRIAVDKAAKRPSVFLFAGR